MAALAKIKNALFRKTQGTPGKSVDVSVEEMGFTSNSEIYHLPGFFSMPVDYITGVKVDVQGNNVIVATHDYRLNISLDKGEAQMYSCDSNAGLLATIKLNKSSEIILNGGTDNAIKYTGYDADIQNIILQINTNFMALQSVLAGAGIPWTPATISRSTTGSKVDKVKL